MEYCKRCCYPANAKPTIIFDDEGVCSGCRVTESRPEINWEERGEKLKEIMAEYHEKAKKSGSPYDCIIPVSGGKDSLFQIYYIKEVLGYNPLLVSFNHGFNTKRGIRNLTNMVKQFDCNLVRFSVSPEAARNISRFMLKKVGDITWHYHAGIMTYPIRAAVMYKIPLVVWGEHGFSDLVGMYDQEDMIEFTKKVRQEHSMRGFEPEEILNDPENKDITAEHLEPFVYPSEEEIEDIGVRGIYISNFMHWDARKQTKLMIEKYNFETAVERERTHHFYDKLDDIHANGLHDYLKYLKFGYGRGTDDASHDIRHGYLTREEAVEKVKKHDHVRPHDMDIWLKFVGMKEEELLKLVDPLRDPQIWEKNSKGEWYAKDSIANHVNDPGVDDVRVPLVEDREMLCSTNQPSYSRDDHISEDSEYIWL
jgi:N-acetyl sugar amidotransferase